MRLLLDNNLAVRLTDLLKAGDHDVQHVRSLGLSAASDETILQLARDADRVLISADTDFGALLARTHATTPSFIRTLPIK